MLIYLYLPSNIFFYPELTLIYVDEGGGDNIRSFANQLESYRKIGEVVNPLARERGTAVFLLVHPKPGLDERYKKELAVKRLQ